jgi:hypothetical protein
MGSDLRMGLDPRDCRCDAAMVLGDGTIGDDIYWRIQDRDKTCVWLDFIDGHFDSLINSEVPASEIKKASVNVELAEISAPRKMSTETQTDKTYSGETISDKMEDSALEARISITETSAVRENKVITVNIPNRRINVISLENNTVDTRGD